MNNSSKFFKNTECEYYPCHKGTEELNCLFCYCPLYRFDNCPGSPEYKVREGRTIKICTDCTFPHEPENYEAVIEMIKESM